MSYKFQNVAPHPNIPPNLNADGFLLSWECLCSFSPQGGPNAGKHTKKRRGAVCKVTFTWHRPGVRKRKGGELTCHQTLPSPRHFVYVLTSPTLTLQEGSCLHLQGRKLRIREEKSPISDHKSAHVWFVSDLWLLIWTQVCLPPKPFITDKTPQIPALVWDSLLSRCPALHKALLDWTKLES